MKTHIIKATDEEIRNILQGLNEALKIYSKNALEAEKLTSGQDQLRLYFMEKEKQTIKQIKVYNKILTNG
jgi:hypothetical protein